MNSNTYKGTIYFDAKYTDINLDYINSLDFIIPLWDDN